MLKQGLSQKLSQKLSPQQIQFIKLLQMNTLDFEQKLDQELLDNPTLEKVNEDDFSEQKDEIKDDFDEYNSEDGYKDVNIEDYISNDDGGDRSAFHLNEDQNEDDNKEIPIAENVSFYEFLVSQAKSSLFKKALAIGIFPKDINGFILLLDTLHLINI